MISDADAGIRSEDAGTFGCLLQGDVDIVSDDFINVIVRGGRCRCCR